MNDKPSPKAIVFADADNTLWDTDGLFAHAQLQMLKNIERVADRITPAPDRLDFVRQIDQAIAARHHLGLRYPPRLLAQALARALDGEPPESAAKAVWKGASGDILSQEEASAIANKFTHDLNRSPALLPGVRTALKRLHASGTLILVLTEGDRSRAIRTATEHRIMTYFDRLISAPKTTQLYKRVLQLVGRPDHCFMIGDQLQRDIAPSNAAGLTTIYVPGRFKPRWEPDELAVGPTHRVERFAQGVGIVLRTIRGTNRPKQPR